MEERSFHYKGRKFPICARCTGILIGMLAVIPLVHYPLLPFPLLCFMMFPLVGDGMLQKITAYESNNIKRMITGLMFGFGAAQFFFMSLLVVYEFGYTLGS